MNDVEKNSVITYQGSQITLFSNNRADYVNLTEMANAARKGRSIIAWIRNMQSIDFLNVWEKKYNSSYTDFQLGEVYKALKDRKLSVKQWIELTNAIGIFTKTGEHAGTYAHKDIAIRFAGWLSPEFELYLIDEIQRLKEIEQKKNSFELLSHEQILQLVRLKEVFKYVVNQEAVELAHQDVYASKSNANNPYAEFQVWRNKMLGITKDVIDEKIKQYCIANNIALAKNIIQKSKREKILFLDSYESVQHAVWDFLKMKGELNASNLATLVGDILRTEKGEIFRKNEDNLFQIKQDLANYNDFDKKINLMFEVVTARKIIALRAPKSMSRPSKSNFRYDEYLLPKSITKDISTKFYDSNIDY